MLTKNIVFASVTVLSLGFSALAVAGTPAPTCGGNPFRPANQCCYANQEYSIGSRVNQAGVVMRCDAPKAFEKTAHFAKAK
ncbi:DUF1496 domain-containing protein [Acidithiobacillus thiooxidans]|uniref:DUF1496 domain-containing protein n=1 Tax=Acidithiobacillus TaxID=119977 RepID=UPI001C071C98|nr:DUF1496 domain-containing protein [Acidithiobacillus thiooxidans]MBU2840121.1 DUF1496 domain-containing protein [Acidithiobacillus thiooxidans]